MQLARKNLTSSCIGGDVAATGAVAETAAAVVVEKHSLISFTRLLARGSGKISRHMGWGGGRGEMGGGGARPKFTSWKLR